MKTIKITSCSEIPRHFTGVTVYSNGSKEWFKDGDYHREDGPAIEEVDGSKEWWVEGNRHREDGPAVEYPNGEKQWFKEGMFHREDGPAREYPNGAKFYYLEGKQHREDGPAVEYSNGPKLWYLEGKEYDRINLKDQIILDEYKGKYGIMWYRLLDKDEIFECPDIPGLIIK